MRTAPLCMLGFVLVVGACGPDVAAEDVFPRNCGIEGPVDLFEPGSADVRTAHAVGDRVVVELVTDGWTEIVAVDRCGGEPDTLLRTPTNDLPIIGSFGQELLACDPETGGIDRLDLRGNAAPERIFDASGCCVYPVAGGLAARNTDAGTIEFISSPGASVATRTTIVTEANESTVTIPPDRFVACGLWWSDIEPVVLGEILLVPLRGGGLEAVDPRSGARSLVADGELNALRPVDGERYALWAVDGVETYVFDRSTGTSTQVGTWAGWVRPLGDWIVDAPDWPYPDGTYVAARHLPDGETHLVATDTVFGSPEERASWNGWWPSSPLSPEAIVVEIPVEEFGVDVPLQSHVFWPETGVTEPVDLPSPTQTTRVVTDGGVFAFDDDSIRFLPPQGPPMRTLLDTRPRHAYVTPGADLIYVQYGPEATSGPLRILLSDGHTYDIDHDVIEPLRSRSDWVNHHDDPDLVYVAAVDGRTVVRRTILP